MVPFHEKAVYVAGIELLAEATLNNCSDIWTAVVRSGTTLVATGAGSSPDDAIAAAVERAERAMAAVAPR